MKYNEKEKFILMAVTTTPEFTQVGNKLGVRIALSFAHHVDMMAREAWKRGVRKVAVYTVSFETSKRWGAHFEKVWQAKGGQIVAREETAVSSSDHYSRITKLMISNPDAILVPSWSDEPASVILKQARELGYKGKFLFTEAMEGVRLLGLVSPKESEGSLLVQSQSSLDTPALRAFRQRYLVKYPDGVFQSAGPKSYEGVYMAAAAMEKAGTVTDVFKIRTAMPSVTPVPEEFRAAGFMKVTPEGDVGGGSIVFEFKNGKRELVAQSDSFDH
jgi:branched-chain amino acid transport system substrate-binding protein